MEDQGWGGGDEGGGAFHSPSSSSNTLSSKLPHYILTQSALQITYSWVKKKGAGRGGGWRKNGGCKLNLWDPSHQSLRSLAAAAVILLPLRGGITHAAQKLGGRGNGRGQSLRSSICHRSFTHTHKHTFIACSSSSLPSCGPIE